MLLSDADREALYEQLKRHAAEGRLSVEELERRVAVVAMAEDRETAAAAMADLPPLPAPTSGGTPERAAAMGAWPRRRRCAGARLAADE